MGGVCTKGSAKQQAMETPVKRIEESRWVSAGKQISGEAKSQEVAEAVQEWLSVNPGWKYSNEFRDETTGEGDTAQTCTFFRVTKVDSKSIPKGDLPASTTNNTEQERRHTMKHDPEYL